MGVAFLYSGGFAVVWKHAQQQSLIGVSFIDRFVSEKTDSQYAATDVVFLFSIFLSQFGRQSPLLPLGSE